jgi:glycine cleavage system protein P-like pyridoxal-binding family
MTHDPKNQEREFTSGFNDLKQVEMSLDAAQRMVGYATMSMDPEYLQDAAQAVQDAKMHLKQAKTNATGVDGEFLKKCEQALMQYDEQLKEAMK